MSSRRTQHSSRFRPRSAEEDGVELADLSLEERAQNLESFVSSISALSAPADAVFTSRAKQDLALAMWTNRTGLEECDLVASNPELVQVLLSLTGNRVGSADEQEVEFMLVNVARCQSQRNIPLLTARISVEALRTNTNHNFWLLVSRLAPGLLCSRLWTQQFVDYALKFEPVHEPNAVGVGAAVFDNYARRLLYKSMVTTESSGYLYKMTNWGHLTIPAHLADPHFNAYEICARPRRQQAHDSN